MTTYRCYFCQHELTPDGEQCASRTCRKRQILRDRFRILSILGQGGYGLVYEVLDELFDVKRAIKRISATSATAQNQIQSELRLLARHARNLRFMPEIYDVWSEDTETYLVMEFIEGETLRQSVARQGLWSSVSVERFLRQVLGYLGQMEHVGLVHRDLKPDNIKLKPDGTFVLIDFGIAKHGEGTGTGVRGAYSRYFASPEQVLSQPTDIRSDLYSLGVTAYWLLTGTTAEDSADRVRFGIPVQPLSFHDIEAPESLESVIMVMLALDPADRPQRPEEAIRALDELPGQRPRIGPKNAAQLSALANISCTFTVASGVTYDSTARTSFSLDGRYLLVPTPIQLHVWDTIQPAQYIFHSPAYARVTAYAWSRTGSDLVIAFDDGLVHLWEPEQGTITALDVNGSDVRHFAWRPDDRALAVQLEGGHVLIWQRDDFAWVEIPERSIQTEKRLLWPVRWSHDSQRLAVVTSEKTISLYLADGARALTIETPAPVALMRFRYGQPPQLVTWANDGVIRIWDAEGRLAESFHEDDPRYTSTINDLVAQLFNQRSPVSQNRLDVLSESPPFLTIGVEGQPAQYYVPITDEPRHYAWNHDHTILALFFDDGTLRVWRRSSKTTIDSWGGDGRVLVATTIEQTSGGSPARQQMTLLRANGSLIAPLLAGHQTLWVDWSPDRQHFVVYDDDGLWAGKIYICGIDGTLVPIDELGEIGYTAWTSDSRHLVIEGLDRVAQLFKVSGAFLGATDLRPVHGTYLCSKDGSLLARIHTEDNHAELVRLDGTWRLALTGALDEYTASAREGIAWNQYNRLVAIGLSNGELKLWSDTGQLWHALVDQHDAIFSVRFSPDGQLLETRSVAGVTHIWSLVGQPRRVFEMPSAGPIWSDTWQLFAALTDGGVIHIYRRDGTRYAAIAADAGTHAGLSWSPNERMLAVRSRQSVVTVWHVNGSLAFACGSESEPLPSICWSPDGRVLAGLHVDGTASLWDMAGRELTRLPGWPSWSPDSRLIGLTVDGTLRIMGIAPRAG